jgi:PAS domain S-box-containing protein
MTSQLERIKELTFELNDAQAYIDEFFNLSLDLFCISDKVNFLLVDNSWKDVLGWDREELEGKPWRDFLHPEDLAKSNDACFDMENNHLIDFVNRLRCKDGTYKEVEWRATKWTNGRTYAVGRPS